MNGEEIVSRWDEKGRTEDSGTVALEAGRRYDIMMEFYQKQGGAMAQLYWEAPGGQREIIPAHRLFPSAAAADSGGLTGEYAAGPVYGDLRGATNYVKRIDPAIDFDWNQEGPDVLRPPNYEELKARLPSDARPGAEVVAVRPYPPPHAPVQRTSVV